MNKVPLQHKVVVTGATGFVGQHLIPRLLQHGFDVLAIARDFRKAQSFEWFNKVEFVSADISEGARHLNISAGMSLIHLAWSDLPNYNSAFHFENNLPKSYDFIKSCINCGVGQVLVTGTCFEYGFQSGPIASNAEAYPNNSYAFAKDVLHQQLRFLAKERPFHLQWARLFYMYGKGQHPKSVLSQLDVAIENGDAVFNMSGGEQLRDYLPIEAATQQLLDLYVSGREGTYNVCSEKPISVRRLAEERVRERSSPIKLNLGYYTYADHEPMAFWGVRDIGETIYLPALPNVPLKTKEENHNLAPVRLRLNTDLNFIENEASSNSIFDYRVDCENSQAYSAKFLEHMTTTLNLLKQQVKQHSLIVEVGCGKGDFVEMVQTDGFFNIQGYDALYEGSNPSVEKRYLNACDKIKADLVILRQVLEHVPNPYQFLSMLKEVFGKTRIYIEVPNKDWIVTHQTFFDISYEHVNYFSQLSLKKLFDAPTTIHGLLFDEQYQYVVADLTALNLEFNELYETKQWQYVSFADLFPNLQEDIKRLETAAHGRSVYLWGAATKGCLFLAHCAHNNQLIGKVVFAIDQNPQKIGKFLPGSQIPIKSKEEFFKSAKHGDILIVSNSEYKEEIGAEIKAAGLTQIKIETL